MGKNILKMILLWNLILVVPVFLVYYTRMLSIAKKEIEIVVYPTIMKEELLLEKFGKDVEVKKCNVFSNGKSDTIGTYNYYCLYDGNKNYKVKFYWYVKGEKNQKAYELDNDVYYVKVCEEGCDEQ